MLGALFIDDTFLGYVICGFRPAAIAACWFKIALTVRAAVAEGYDMICFPVLASANLTGTEVAAAIVAVKNT